MINLKVSYAIHNIELQNLINISLIILLFIRKYKLEFDT
jgi:hypothetical protein